MAVPTASLYPAALDSNASLFGFPVNKVILTLDGDISDTDTSLVVNEDISGINVPTFFTFETGEVIYAESKNDGAKSFLSLIRGHGGTANAGHSDGEALYLSVAADYLAQLQRALYATQGELGTNPKGSYADVKTAINAAVQWPWAFQVIAGDTLLTTGDGKVYVPFPDHLNGCNLVSVGAAVVVKSTSGLPEVQLARGRQSSPTADFSYVDMLSTTLTIDADEYHSKDANTPAVIDTSNDDIATGDILRIDVDAAGTGTKGLMLFLRFALP